MGERAEILNSVTQTSGHRVAIVHDALVTMGGAERVVSFLLDAFPEAPVFTSAYFPDRTFSRFRAANVIPMQFSRVVATEKGFKQLFPLWVLGFQMLDLQGFDFVLSSSTFAAKYVRRIGRAKHACYCYAPLRFLWKTGSYSGSSAPFGRRAQGAVRLITPMLRSLDYHSMQRIPKIATTCVNMANEIRHCYGREAKIIHAPIRVSDYRMAKGDGDYYLSVSRLIAHKRVDLAIMACNALRRKLVVVGDGPESEYLREISGSTICMRGAVSDADLRELYRGCRALIFASHEDYGLVPLEVQACGRPVIALRAGGNQETVKEYETGTFFEEQSVASLKQAMLEFEKLKFDATAIRAWAESFDSSVFIRRIKEWLFEA